MYSVIIKSHVMNSGKLTFLTLYEVKSLRNFCLSRADVDKPHDEYGQSQPDQNTPDHTVTPSGGAADMSA